jgi:glycerol kinase
MMTEVILGIDQGSSSTRCLAFDRELQILASASRPVQSEFPRAGWVEHDPEQIFLGTLQTLDEARQSVGASWDQVAGIGIATQTETFVVWERASGRPVYPAISWRDQRSAEACESMKERGLEATVRRKTGLELESTFSAPKLRWLLENVEGAEQRARAGELVFGDVACWLLWRLSDGAAHLTEPSNAHRSLLVTLDALRWDEELLELFGVPAQMLPEIRDSDAVATLTDPAVCGGEVPVRAMLGDQQAALLGQGGVEEGMANLTLGTGAFVWANAGQLPPEPAPGVLASCAWRSTVLGTAYALEGFVTNAGNVVKWLRDSGLLQPREELQEAFDSEADPMLVPAFAGLGTPHWNPVTIASLFGMSNRTTLKDISAAALMGVVHQVVDAIEAVAKTRPLALLRVAGGMSANDPLVQTIADLCRLDVERTSFPEATSRGVGWLAARGSGLVEGAGPLDQPVRRFEPLMDADAASEARRRWRHALTAHLAYARDHAPS